MNSLSRTRSTYSLSCRSSWQSLLVDQTRTRDQTRALMTTSGAICSGDGAGSGVECWISLLDDVSWLGHANRTVIRLINACTHHCTLIACLVQASNLVVTSQHCQLSAFDSLFCDDSKRDIIYSCTGRQI